MFTNRSLRRPSTHLSLAALVFLNASALAGDLTPPPGPITSTMKTLDEVEARVPVQSLPAHADYLHHISESGSYYLTADLVVPPGVESGGILIDADWVTLDLNGFSVVGNDYSTDPFMFPMGIDAVDQRGITVRNGKVRGFVSGVRLHGGQSHMVQDLTIKHWSHGIQISGKDSLVLDCVVGRTCGSCGYLDYLVIGGRARGCTADATYGSIWAQDGAVIERCQTSGMIQAYDEATISGCVAASIRVEGDGAVITENTTGTIELTNGADANLVARNVLSVGVSGSLSANDVAPVVSIAEASHPFANILH